MNGGRPRGKQEPRSRHGCMRAVVAARRHLAHGAGYREDASLSRPLWALLIGANSQWAPRCTATPTQRATGSEGRREARYRGNGKLVLNPLGRLYALFARSIFVSNARANCWAFEREGHRSAPILASSAHAAAASFSASVAASSCSGAFFVISIAFRIARPSAVSAS